MSVLESSNIAPAHATSGPVGFGDFVLDRADERLSGPSGPVRIGQKAYRVLCALLDANGHLVTKDGLFEDVWDGTIVGESALTSVIKELRRALGDDRHSPKFIESVYGRGYRFLAPLSLSGKQAETAVDRAAQRWVQPSAKPSIAVMPFADLGEAQNDDYFAAGMLVEIVTALSRFQSLFVISSGTVLSLRGDSRPVAEIAHELGVRYILQGTVRKADDRVRIAVELIDDAGRSTIWMERFEGSLDDIFALQDEVSNAVASQIEPSIKATEVRRAADRPTSDNSAYDLYLRGTHAYWERWTQDSLSRAAALFKQSATLDPEFALAQVYSSNTLINCVLQGHADDPSAMMREGARFARAALLTGQNDAEVLSIASYTLFLCEEPLANVDSMIERALAINPGLSICHYVASIINMYACRPEVALEFCDTALRLDPRTPWYDRLMVGRANVLFMLERYDEALPLYAQAEIAFPEIAPAVRRISAICYAMTGDADRALATPGITDPISANEEFLISRYRDPAFRQKLRDGIAMVIGMSSA